MGGINMDETVATILTFGSIGLDGIIDPVSNECSKVFSSGEGRLLHAMMTEAVKTYLNPGENVRTLRLVHEAEEWIFGLNEYYWSFDEVCGFLGIEVSGARRALRQARARVGTQPMSPRRESAGRQRARSHRA